MSIPDSYQLRGAASTITTDLVTPKRALAIGAHPDDVEFGCGATLAKWAADGCEIFHLVLTDGSKGTWDGSVDTAQLVVTRQHEQREASIALGGRGGNHVAFLGWIDGELESGLRQRWEVAHWIREWQPDVVLGHDPWRRYRIHPDHRHAGLLACEGIVAARDPKFFPEQHLAPHRPSALLLWEADEVNHVESCDDDALEAKTRALLAHQSQYETTMHLPTDSTTSGSASNSTAAIDVFRSTVWAEAQNAARPAGMKTGEAFALLTSL
jgi:LmbE family N-acetylglucosaminyl deacetylase